MPFSSDSGKSWIVNQVRTLSPKSVLDIGAGSGTYAKLFKAQWPGAKWVAVEVWPKYIEQYKLGDLYDEVYATDVREWRTDKTYDIAFVGDILEHMTAEDAAKVLEYVRKIAKYVFVSIPIGYYPQGEYEGNPYEIHVKDDWDDASVRRIFGEPSASTIDNEIGVYLYRDRLNITVYAISKNEAQFVERFCLAAKDADKIIVADTGSNDGTQDLLRQHGAIVHEISIKPWRFDDARNAALALLPADTDICVSLDLDEVLQPGWREQIERAWVPGTTRLRYLFDWGAGIAFYYEKIHARYGYRWHHPCHEYPVPDRIVEVWAQTDQLLVVHQPDPTKSRGQYLDLLRISIEEDPSCPRNAFYYARELSFHRQWREAITQAERYLALPRATWANERCYAMRVILRSYAELGENALAMQWARRATSEAPDTREPWCELAMLCYRAQRWAECFGAAITALDIKDRAKVYTVDPEVWGAQPHDLAAVAAWNLGLNDVALTYAKQALGFAPDDDRLKKNVELMSKQA
jgi:hypothetical protein